MGIAREETLITRVNRLTATAKSAWLAYLAVLTFLTVAALGVTDEDFFGIGRTTKLPLVDIDVPTRLFFALSPLLASASYSYLHLYLLRLFFALSYAPSRVEGDRLAEYVVPWIVTDTALGMRGRLRNDGCTSEKPLDGLLHSFNLITVWLAGPIVIGLLWWESMTARDAVVSLVAFLGVISSCATGATSYFVLRSRMSGREVRPGEPWNTAPFMACLLFALVIGFSTSHTRTLGRTDLLATVDLTGSELVAGSTDWASNSKAQQEYFEEWCLGVAQPCQPELKRSATFVRSWNSQREFDIGLMAKSDLNGFHLAGVILERAFLPGVDLSDTHLVSSRFGGATAELVDFSRSDLTRSNFDRADLTSANFDHAILTGTSFGQAQLTDANFSFAYLKSTNIDNATLSNVTFGYAYLEGISVLQGFKRVDSLLGSLSFGRQTSPMPAALPGEEIDLRGTSFKYAAIRNYNFSGGLFDDQTNLRDAFIDGSVVLPADLIGDGDRPCHWVSQIIEEDSEFFGRWRGYIESQSRNVFAPKWEAIAPIGWSEVTPIEPEEC